MQCLCYPVPRLGLAGMLTDDQFATYDLSLCISLSTPNIMQNADMMSAVFCYDSSIAHGLIRSSMYIVLCVYEFSRDFWE